MPGGDYSFPVVSVGATENALMAAVLATGRTPIVQRRARARDRRPVQPAGGDGRQDQGDRLGHLIINGVEALHGATYDVMPDRIEAGSYACAAGITGGSIDLVGAKPEDMLAIMHALSAAGLIIEFHDKGIKVSADGPMKPLALSTAPYPGFPTDMQAQFMAMLSLHQRRELPRGNDLREPLHARSRAAPDGRPGRCPRPLGDRPRRAQADRRAGHGDRPARLDEPGARRAWPRRARPKCCASTTSTAATSGSRRS